MVVFKNALKKREREKEEGSSGTKLNRYPRFILSKTNNYPLDTDI